MYSLWIHLSGLVLYYSVTLSASKSWEVHLLKWNTPLYNLSFSLSDSNDECEMFICKCDKAAAECFAQSPYNASNNHLPSSVCSSASREISSFLTTLTAFTVTLTLLYHNKIPCNTWNVHALNITVICYHFGHVKPFVCWQLFCIYSSIL